MRQPRQARPLFNISVTFIAAVAALFCIGARATPVNDPAAPSTSMTASVTAPVNYPAPIQPANGISGTLELFRQTNAAASRYGAASMARREVCVQMVRTGTLAASAQLECFGAVSTPGAAK